MQLTEQQLKIIPKIQRKYNVSIGFLKSNLANIEKFLWYALSPRLVIKRIAIRKGNKPRIILNYYHLRRVLFDQADRKVIKTRRRNVQQWSRQMVAYLRRKYGIKERIEITTINDTLSGSNKAKDTMLNRANLAPDEVSKQMKEQLEILRSGKRIVPLMESEIILTEDNNQNNATNSKDCNNITPSEKEKTESIFQNTLETTPEKQIMGSVEARAEQPRHSYKTDRNIDVDNESVELPPSNKILETPSNSSTKSRVEMLQQCTNKTTSKSFSSNSNFLDMLVNKVRSKNTSTETCNNVKATTPQPPSVGIKTPEVNIDKAQDCNEQYTDSGEEFFGFDEAERLPGMMLTPLVPFSAQSKGNTNGAFISESLNEFMRENLLESSDCIAEGIKNSSGRKLRQATLDGLVTPDCVPPRIEMPLVPESLQKLRTVAERRQYLQKFNRNHKLSIINNEAAICRELQRKIRHRKSKSVSQQLLQAPNSQMPFTRQGWQAASFVTTEFNHYYYQTLDVNDGKEQERVRLTGVRGNNVVRNKQSYLSRVPSNQLSKRCNINTCSDAFIWRDLKPIKSEPDKKKLNKSPLPSVFKPCPLSHKPFQKPLDDETAPLLLAGGSMAVVRMPIVELEVFPALGKPLHEVAKRYLDYILPHCDITREWAEFSVSTLQDSAEYKKNYDLSNQTNDRLNCSNSTSASFTFPIPYLNDRSHILVRRVVDRSEKLDETFEATKSPVEDFSFRANIDESDNVMVECADVLSEMINSVAISCSENSFIKEDPDGLRIEKNVDQESIQEKSSGKLKDEKICNTKPSDESKLGGQTANSKKQNRLLLELRRLNATIIDAAVKSEKGTKPCAKEYCTFGCICQSLADDYPLRQHCGKSKCVIECTCKTPSQSRIMRLETDGRSITTEDAFMLRRQATARLARMEKEFTSTIVLTENETLLINESQYDKKRRCTKAPKRYEDFADNDEDYTGKTLATGSPNKTQNTALVAIEAPTDTSPNSGFLETTTELREPIYVNDNVLEQLKHCTIPLMRFEDTQNMAVWCMVHELYKCYCGGRAIEGKPLVIEKDNNTTTIHKETANLGNRQIGQSEEEYVVTSTKARYSFEKVEHAVEEEEEEDKLQEETVSIKKRLGKRKSTDRKSQGSAARYDSTDDESFENDQEDEFGDSYDSDFEAENSRSKRPKLLTNRQERRGRPSEQSFINKYFNTEADGCRRVVVIPRKTYLRINRKRRAEVEEFIAKNENKRTVLLLNEHILRSVYYHKHEVEKQRKEAALESVTINKKRKLQEKKISESEDNANKESIQQKIESAKTMTENNEDQPIVEITDEDSCHSSLSSLLSQSSSKLTIDTKLTNRRQHRKRNTARNNSIEEDVSKRDNSSVVEENSNPPVFVSTEKIKNTETIENSTQEKSTTDLTLCDDAQASVSTVSEDVTDFSSGTSECSAALSLNMPPSSSLSTTRLDFFKDVVRSMNSLVNKKMQDIGLALKRESKVIPAPNNEILCIIKWSNFLDAFVEGFVFIWQVKLADDQSFFAATISNMMPMVLNAVGVMNIAALPMQQVPLLGRMLLQRCRSPQTNDLAIVMQGRAKYWLVKGFLRADKSSACAKPTPKSHPLLTRKINVLSSLLAKQHIREMNKKAAQKQNEKLPENLEVEGAIAAPIKVTPQAATPIQQSLLKPKLLSSLPPVQNEQKQKLFNTNKSIQKPNIDATAEQKTSEIKTTLQNKVPPTKSSKGSSSAPNNNSTIVKTDKTNSKSGLTMLQELIENSQYKEIKSNISFRKVTAADISELYGLDITTEPHRWLVLDLYKDFSHIYVPDFQELVSLDRIQKVMAFSRQKQKIVKLQFFQNAAYDAFVTPNSERKIYFGPLKWNTPLPLLILLQSVDRKMMLRETYQQMHNIQGEQDGSTTAFCVERKNEEIHLEYELDESTANTKDAEGKLFQPVKTVQPNIAESDDDDCMIVEDNKPEMPFSQLIPLSQPNITVKPLSELQSQPNQSTLSRQLTNFTIQTNANSNRLQIIKGCATPTTTNHTSSKTNPEEVPTAQLQMLSNSTNTELLAGTQMPHPQVSKKLMQSSSVGHLTSAPTLLDKQATPILCSLPPNAVITGVTTAPQEAPYGSTIFISGVTSLDQTVSCSEQSPDMQTTIATNSNTIGALSNVRYLTPDVRVTATGESTSTESLPTPTLTTMSSSNAAIFSLPKTPQVNKMIDIPEILPLQTSADAENTHAAINRKSLPTEVKNVANGDWKRFLLDDCSKSSTIGSTTITKMPEKLEYTPEIYMPAGMPQIPINIEQDDFEPIASVVFKPIATTKTTENTQNNSMPNGTRKAACLTSTKVATANTTSTSSITPASQPASKTDNATTKAQVMTIPFRTMASAKEPIKSRNVTPTTIVSKPTIIPNVRKISNSSPSVSKGANMSVPKVIASNQSLVQQLKKPSQPLKPPTTQSFAPRLILPNKPRPVVSSPAVNTVSTASPKPLINIRAAIPIPQRTYSMAHRRSDSTPSGPNILGKKSSNVTLTKKASEASTTMLSRTGSVLTSKHNATVNINSKLTEQYGVFCSASNDNSPKFWAKRVVNAYLIKVPGVTSVVHCSDLESVGTYLNQHLMKQSPVMKSKLPIRWKFVPSDQLPVKMLTTNKDGSTSEKILMRCVKVTENSASEPKVTPPANISNSRKGTVNVTTSHKKGSEPILIED
ncbi:uncharacterized protein LOC101457273 isoform X2 [Ceratitis capitata]|nr:uncharacterized protein LOC101457273 isoform X2 [Ceratitis capitata]CAD7011365.1 unnamed protein product [Ceratitis capitata]